MVFPAKGTNYDLNPTEHASITLKHDGRYLVSIVQIKHSRDELSSMLIVKFKLIFDTFEEVKKHLYEYADEDHKDQFKDKDEKAP